MPHLGNVSINDVSGLVILSSKDFIVLSDTQTCFICNQVLHGDSEAVNLHIDQCLANMNNNTAESSTSGGGTWVEYEWAGQTRVRATAMMEGGYSGK